MTTQASLPCALQPKLSAHRPLTRLEMAYLMSLADCGNRLIALFRCLLGARAWDEAESVNPRLIKIPKRQWVELCDGNMIWVNIGPSSYDEGGVS